MALRYTPEEIARRVQDALPPIAVVSRRDLVDGTDLILSLQDIIGRVLNSDLDAIHYLVGMKAQDLWVVCGRILVTLNNLERQALAATQSSTTAPSRVEELLDTLDEIQVSGRDVRPNLIRRLKTLTAQYARGSVDENGRMAVGLSPQIAREETVSLLADLRGDLALLSRDLPIWMGCFARYQTFDVTAATDQRAAAYARDLLSTRAGQPTSAQSEGIIDALVASAMLDYTVTRLDVLQDKYEGNPEIVVDPNMGEDLRILTLPADQPSELVLRVGDVVLARASGSDGYFEVVGEVERVIGRTVKFRTIAPGLPNPVPEGSRDIVIRSVGLHSFTVARGDVLWGLRQSSGLLAHPDPFVEAVTAYAQSGARSGMYTEGFQALRQAVTTIRTALGGFRSSRVAAVDALLEHLHTERLDLVAGAVMNLRFDLLTNITALLSGQDSIEYLAGQILVDLEEGAAPYATSVIEDQYEDYFRTGE